MCHCSKQTVPPQTPETSYVTGELTVQCYSVIFLLYRKKLDKQHTSKCILLCFTEKKYMYTYKELGDNIAFCDNKNNQADEICLHLGLILVD